jgi:aryl-alcohol dehydrogenase-like predicted oxidoreductase
MNHDVDHVSLGSTGTRVSRLCFGTWRFAKEVDGTVETDRERAHEVLDACEAAGINFLDTANVYGTPRGRAEEYVGEWLAERDREEYVIASKAYFPMGEGPNDRGLGRKHLRAQIEGTLDRLGTDYLDLYYVHRFDESTPLVETLSTLTDLVREGRVHYLGASAMAAWQLTKALWTSDREGLERFEVTQPMVHAADRERAGEYLDVCADQGLGVCPYSPLAGGFLTGKYERADDGGFVAPDGSRGDLHDDFDEYYVSERGWETLAAIREVADELEATPAQVALRFLMEYGDRGGDGREPFSCVPIVGARTPEQVEENAGAVDLDLDDEQFERVATAGRHG